MVRAFLKLQRRLCKATLIRVPAEMSCGLNLPPPRSLCIIRGNEYCHIVVMVAIVRYNCFNPLMEDIVEMPLDFPEGLQGC